MKIKNLFVLSVALVSMNISAQTAFESLEANKNITTVVVSQKMFQMLSKIDSKDADAKEFMEVANKLKGMKIFTTENTTAAAQMKTEALAYVKTAALSELMRVKDKAQNVKFYTKGGKDANNVAELLMLVEPTENSKQTVVLSLTGDINLNKIGVLTKNMNLPQEVKDLK
ncbi:DUF4252 domain-containing protein [Capnocytophaga sputigena]|uniref:DUF4252 domain-containing protein n=1 Tax=Capnocytophaga sputigena TaxID=1019 RepID=UPI00261B9059|nr:DUF4252 domain-containing protein [Capnocytophaga sputigena]